MNTANWDPVLGIVAEMKRCETAGAVSATVAMAFICIDTMGYLSMPNGQSQQTKTDFMAWADAYLKGHPSQPYPYHSKDVYAARCSLLHAFGSEAETHRKDSSIKKFGYHDGGKHAYDPGTSKDLVIIGVASLVNDVAIGVSEFMEACKKDPDLQARVEGRLPGLLDILPFPTAPNQNV